MTRARPSKKRSRLQNQTDFITDTMYVPPRQHRTFKTPATSPPPTKLRYKVCDTGDGTPVIAVLKNPVKHNEIYLRQHGLDAGKFHSAKAHLVEFRDFDTFEVLPIQKAFSIFDPTFVYDMEHPVVVAKGFEYNPKKLCASGIHYCKTVSEARLFCSQNVSVCQNCKRLCFALGQCKICGK